MLPADYFRVNSQHAHWPLVVMLVLTQLSVGAFIVGLVLENWLSPQLLATLRPLHAAAALGFGLLALAASLLHLGRPQFAFRAVLGLRHSWLSREIVAFGAFAALATLYSVAVFVMRPITVAGAADVVVVPWIRWLGWSVALAGVIAVFCSTMIYVFTQRECWSFVRVGVRFAADVARYWVWPRCGSAFWPRRYGPHRRPLFALAHECGPTLCRTLVALVAAKLTFEAAVFRHLSLRQDDAPEAIRAADDRRPVECDARTIRSGCTGRRDPSAVARGRSGDIVRRRQDLCNSSF